MKWDKANKKADLRELVDTGNKIVELDNTVDGNHFLVNRKTELINLECHRANILAQIESTWRLKSKALWIKEGDSNTRYASHRRNMNSIWELKTVDDNALTKKR